MLNLVVVAVMVVVLLMCLLLLLLSEMDRGNDTTSVFHVLAVETDKNVPLFGETSAPLSPLPSSWPAWYPPSTTKTHEEALHTSMYGIVSRQKHYTL